MVTTIRACSHSCIDNLRRQDESREGHVQPIIAWEHSSELLGFPKEPLDFASSSKGSLGIGLLSAEVDLLLGASSLFVGRDYCKALPIIEFAVHTLMGASFFAAALFSSRSAASRHNALCHH